MGSFAWRDNRIRARTGGPHPGAIETPRPGAIKAPPGSP